MISNSVDKENLQLVEDIFEKLLNLPKDFMSEVKIIELKQIID